MKDRKILTVKINYKSGHSEIIDVYELDLKYEGDSPTNLSWEIPLPGKNFFFTSLKEIESIWILKIKKERWYHIWWRKFSVIFN